MNGSGKGRNYLRCLPCLGIRRIHRPDLDIQRRHSRAHLHGIVKYISALLRVHARNSVQEVALETERERGAGVDDLFACLLDLDGFDGLAGDTFGYAAAADSRDAPRMRGKWVS